MRNECDNPWNGIVGMMTPDEALKMIFFFIFLVALCVCKTFFCCLKGVHFVCPLARPKLEDLFRDNPDLV
jgi:hypothetical protein